MRIKGVTGQSIAVKGKTVVTVKLAVGVQKTAEAVVVANDAGIQSEILIGTDLQCDSEAKIDLSRGEITFYNTGLSTNATKATGDRVLMIHEDSVVMDVHTDYDLVIPGYENVIMSICKPGIKNGDTYLVQNNVTSAGLMVASSLVVVKNESLPIMFLNPNREEVKLQGGALITRIEKLEDKDLNEVDVVDARPKAEGRQPEVTRELINASADDETTDQLLDILNKNRKGIALKGEPLGCTHLLKHNIILKDPDAVVYTKLYRTPVKYQEIMKTKVEKMIEDGIICESMSPFNSPILIVQKKGKGEFRLVVDFRKLSAITRPARYPLLNISDLIQSIDYAIGAVLAEDYGNKLAGQLCFQDFVRDGEAILGDKEGGFRMAVTTALALRTHAFGPFSCCKNLISDNAPEFKGGVLESLREMLNIKHIFTPAYTPASNGNAERKNQNIIRALKHYVNRTSLSDWDEFIPEEREENSRMTWSPESCTVKHRALKPLQDPASVGPIIVKEEPRTPSVTRRVKNHELLWPQTQPSQGQRPLEVGTPWRNKKTYSKTGLVHQHKVVHPAGSSAVLCAQTAAGSKGRNPSYALPLYSQKLQVCPPPTEIAPCTCSAISKGLEIVCDHSNEDHIRNTLNVLKHNSISVYWMRFRNCKLPRVSDFIFMGLDVIHLNIIRSNVSVIESSSLSALGKSLESLDLASNLLQAIPSSALRGQETLTFLNLNYNRISNLPESAFAGMTVLQRLTLYENRIKDIHHNAFKGIPRLTLLNLGNNLLENIPSDGFHPLVNLEVLDIHENLIKHIPDAAFKGLSKLDILNLEDNRIEMIQDNLFHDLSMLNSLNIKHNKIVNISDNAFNGLETNLGLLELGNNLLDHIPSHALRPLRSLRRLDLDSNAIKEIQEDVFHGYGDTLKYIVLDKNHIMSIPPLAFANLHSLEWLKIAHNEITNLLEDTVQPVLDTLRVLDISTQVASGYTETPLLSLPAFLRRQQRGDTVSSPAHIVVNSTRLTSKDPRTVRRTALHLKTPDPEANSLTSGEPRNSTTGSPTTEASAWPAPSLSTTDNAETRQVQRIDTASSRPQLGLDTASTRPQLGLDTASAQPRHGLITASTRPHHGLDTASARPRHGLITASTRPHGLTTASAGPRHRFSTASARLHQAPQRNLTTTSARPRYGFSIASARPQHDFTTA
ncbi:Leucine-rich repeat [Trinorchestia longiramus]|nr:Leucine-rich repeat [Trinorchestia longiramus]